MKNSKVRFIAYSAMIAAAYVALTMISAAFGLSSGAIQVRISEALCVLPISIQIPARPFLTRLPVSRLTTPSSSL